MKKIFLVFVLVFLGCTQNVAINSDPMHARVYLDGEFKGITPVVVGFPELADSVVVRCEKEGYRTIVRVIVKREEVTRSTTAGVGTGVYTNNRGQYGTVTGTSVHSTTQVSEYWPAELFFRLEKAR